MTADSLAANGNVVLASANAALRHRLRENLTGLRWRVREARGGAEALTLLEEHPSEALLMDNWLPDLEAHELADQIAAMYPLLEVLRVDGGPLTAARSARRNELLMALRELEEQPRSGTAAWSRVPVSTARTGSMPATKSSVGASRSLRSDASEPSPSCGDIRRPAQIAMAAPIAGLVGKSEAMQELAHLIHLVAPRTSTVLIEGETGTGKEVVATALHSLSNRSAKPLTVVNCAAIPDGLLESELFGHARGAFTGAVQARLGRIEAANGGTLFLDEIAEMPLALQAKMLRFLECGELQRLGDNEVVRVDVRVIAATHQDLEQRVVDGSFRLDLYHRLAVFPIEVPALRDRLGDLAELSDNLLRRIGAGSPRKHLSAGALEALQEHHWPGNVRELAHVLERGAILAADAAEIGAEHIRFRRKPRS